MRELKMKPKLSRASLPAIKEQGDGKGETLPGRWDEEREIDKMLKLTKRKTEATVRLRKMNDVANRLLHGKIHVLETDFVRQSNQLRKQTDWLREESREFEPGQSGVVKLPQIQASPVQSSSSVASSRGGDTECRSCLFGIHTNSEQCKYFPCYLPTTYNTMVTVGMRPKTYSVISNYGQMIRRCKGKRPMTSQHNLLAKSITDAEDAVSKAPRVTVKEKERGLRELVKELKQKNEKTKPRDWATNYGDPVRIRMLLKPVVPPDDSVML